MGFFMPKIYLSKFKRHFNIYIEYIIMIKGLAITPPVLGRISIGKMSKRMENVCLKKMINLPLPAKSKIKMGGSNIHWMSNYVPKRPIRTKS